MMSLQMSVQFRRRRSRIKSTDRLRAYRRKHEFAGKQTLILHGLVDLAANAQKLHDDGACVVVILDDVWMESIQYPTPPGVKKPTRHMISASATFRDGSEFLNYGEEMVMTKPADNLTSAYSAKPHKPGGIPL